MLHHVLDRFRLATGRGATLGTVMETLAAIHGDRHLVSEPESGRDLSYRQAAELVSGWSAGIAKRVAPGDRVVIAVPNGYDQFLLCLAAARAGALPVPVNEQMHVDEIAHVERDARAALTVRKVAELSGSADAIDPHPADAGDVAALFYTSGTTGTPKGAVLTHRALVGQMGPMAALPPLPVGEAVAALPVAHIMGFVTMLGLAMARVPLVTYERFRPAQVLDIIARRHASVFVGVPAMYRMLLEAGAARSELSSIRVWMSGADVMPPDLIARFQKLGAAVSLPLVGAVGGATFIEGYGMVEVGGGVAVKVTPPGLPIPGDAIGFRVPGYRFRIVDDGGRQVRLGGVGELLLQGPGVLQGYWDAPEATKEILDADGWLHTGDLVRKGMAGTIVFQGRSKNVIKSGGYSVYPPEIERALEGHPEVLEAAVVGVADAKLGEVPMAAVRRATGSSLDEAELLDWVAERLAHYKAPRRVVFVDDLPRTGTEKVQRDRLRTLFGR